MSSRQPGRRVPNKSHGLRAPGPSGRPPREAAGTPPPGATDAAPPAAPPADHSSFGVPTAKPGSRAANRAAKRAASGGVRPKTQVRSRPGSGARGSSTGLVVLGAIAVVVVAAIVVIANPFGSASPGASQSASPGASAVAYGDGTCPTSQPASLTAGDVYTVTVSTDLGDIVMKIDGGLAPIATGNFVALVKCHYFDGVGFHRLVPGFVIQGGDPDGTGSGPGPGYRIKDDPLTTTYHRGTIAMARTGQPNSQGSQFFIVLADDANAALTDPRNAPYPYAILGEVVAGMDVVDKIAAMANDPSQGNAAIDPVIMNSVTAVSATPSSGPSSGPTAAPSPTPTAAPTATPAAS